MSSHHFVKENQEPALLILEMEGLSFETVAPLLEWVPTVLVSQTEVWTVISWGIKIDVILADLDFQRANYHLLEEQYPVKFLGVQHGKYFQEGLQYLVATKHYAVNIIGLAPWEFEVFPSKELGLDIVLWKSGIRYFPIAGGRFKKWFPKGSLFSYSEKPIKLAMIHDGLETQISFSGKRNLALEEGTTEFFADGFFWLGEKI
ncbi:thiamine pyrophosphokinase [Mariniradius saccharolyticus AK6]|uniref:Thiamine pyrophosphokinase n=1 Tax=Mariniradius saccharolyticus AK6 TaxID=1239962 RepID=M7XEC7_9BACT|nr:hypothetical protein [Mariniradius saccharolyticus]EMS32873.1 thiamine pyrophosphokinase [Mariniradius saccharolyticus AK6]